MEKFRADVTICGENYVLSGEKSEEKIKEIARFVDDEMRRTSKMMNCNPNYKCAVLTALNITEKLMDSNDMLLKLQTENYQLDNDVKHYIQMWENAKKKVTDLKEQMSTEVDRQSQSTEDFNKLKEKLAEMESAYFDLQVENVNLKNQIRSMNKLAGDDEL
ncbi:MAG: cell division protein ZapA [Firmicutes bacterium]|nr:cell division protein ZapA [Bacillota bacterium]